MRRDIGPFDPDSPSDVIADDLRRDIGAVALSMSINPKYLNAQIEDQVQGFISGMMV